mgnify:CR=1 FL=1
MDACTLFIAPGRLSDADAATLAESGVTLRGYEEIIDAVHALPADETEAELAEIRRRFMGDAGRAQ